LLTTTALQLLGVGGGIHMEETGMLPSMGVALGFSGVFA